MPNRLDTIFTSSGCETSLGMSGRTFLGFAAIPTQDPRHMPGTQLIVEVVGYLDGRRPRACADALHLFEREQSIRGHALVPHAQLVLKPLQHVIRAAQHATDVG